eukprot:1618540-Amphidinium_carterae.1
MDPAKGSEGYCRVFVLIRSISSRSVAICAQNSIALVRLTSWFLEDWPDPARRLPWPRKESPLLWYRYYRAPQLQYHRFLLATRCLRKKPACGFASRGGRRSNWLLQYEPQSLWVAS